MLELEVKDIIEFDENDTTPEKILKYFINEQKEEYLIMNIESRQIKNAKILINLLYFPVKKEYKNIPIVVDIPMGEGKSKILEAYYKYLYQNNQEDKILDVIVKKKLEEAHDFSKRIGCLDNDYDNYEWDMIQESNNAKEILDYNKYYDKNENKFRFNVIRGYNTKDCLITDETDENYNDNTFEYDFRKCKQCDLEECNRKKSRKNMFFKNGIVISHARIFFSSEASELIDEIINYYDGEQYINRKNLIIDEKMESYDVISLPQKEFNTLFNVIKEMFKINQNWYDMFINIEKKTFLNQDIKFPTNQKEKSFLNKNPLFIEELKLEDDFYKEFSKFSSYSYEEYLTLLKVQHLLSKEEFISSRKFNSYVKKYKKRKKLISFYRKIPLLQYSKKFEKTIILDATADVDYSILLSEYILCRDISKEKKGLKVFTPSNNCNTNKTHIVELKDGYDEYIKNLSKELINIMEKNNGKTLIVAFKKIMGNSKKEEINFKEDIINYLNRYNDLKNIKMKYELIHHGEYTTGVNKFRDCENLIFVGQLRKNDFYYFNIEQAYKSAYSIDDIVKNEFLVANIQQIGRTAFRSNKNVNVYFLYNKAKAKKTALELKKYFDATIEDYLNNYFYWIKTRTQKKYDITNVSSDTKKEAVFMYLEKMPRKTIKKKKIRENIYNEFSKEVEENYFGIILKEFLSQLNDEQKKKYIITRHSIKRL